MPIAPTYPGVYIEELPSPVHTIAGVATSITGFVGWTSRGIDNRAEQILSFSDYERQFGGIDAQSEVSYSVQQFFANGGAQGYVVRVPRIGASYASVTFFNLVFTALSSGAWANGNLLIDVDYIGVDQTTATGEPSAFNLTITNLDDGPVETFPSVSVNFNKSSYVLPVVNDPDTGSQLVNVAIAAAWSANPSTVPPPQTGLVGAVIVLSPTTQLLTAVNTAVGGAANAATVSANADFGVALNTTHPTPLSPLPIDIKVFARNGTIPQTVAGLATQLEQTINAALAIKWAGASVSLHRGHPGRRHQPGHPNQRDLPRCRRTNWQQRCGDQHHRALGRERLHRCLWSARPKHAGVSKRGTLHHRHRKCLRLADRVSSRVGRLRTARNHADHRRPALLHRHLRIAQGGSVQPVGYSRRHPRRRRQSERDRSERRYQQHLQRRRHAVRAAARDAPGRSAAQREQGRRGRRLEDLLAHGAQPERSRVFPPPALDRTRRTTTSYAPLRPPVLSRGCTRESTARAECGRHRPEPRQR